MGNRYTINDVAKMAGVSKSTVSRYLNGKPVKPEFYDKIEKAVRQCNYRANMFARLSAKQSNIMGIILPGFDSTVTPRVLTAMDKYLRTKKYTPLIINTENDIEFEVQSIEHLANMNVDGIIIVATYITPGHKEAIGRIQTPVIFLGQEYEDGISILDDNYNAGKFLGNYVAGRGAASAGCLWVTEEDIAVGQRRKQGIIDGLKAGGVSEIRTYQADFTYQTAYKTALAALSAPNPPKALLCATDRIAYGAYKAARELHIRIPEDLSVTGFGGYDTSEILTPPLTTIRFDVETAACVCADTILKIRQGEPVSKTQLIGYHFIEGQSVRGTS